jgi:hypothetical protein
LPFGNRKLKGHACGAPKGYWGSHHDTMCPNGTPSCEGFGYTCLELRSSPFLPPK